MSLRHRKKLLNENLLPNQLNQQSDESDESEVTTRKGNNFELVRFFIFMAIVKKLICGYFAIQFLVVGV